MQVEHQCFQVCRQKPLWEACTHAGTYTHANMLTLEAVGEPEATTSNKCTCQSENRGNRAVGVCDCII